MRRAFLLLAAVAICLAQTAAPPVPVSAISAWYLKTGQATNDPAISSTPQYRWAYINPPLSAYEDSTGGLQIGISSYLTQGPQGVPGATGQQGIPGVAGATGSTGAQGIPGAQGATGPQGLAGTLGIAGATGPAGAAGAGGIAVETDCNTAAGCTALGTATTLDIEPGIGEICVPQLSAATGVFTLQCSADTAIIAYRVEPPTASGPCTDQATTAPYSASTWAADGSYFYTCVPVPATPPNSAPPTFIWGRVPLQTGW